MFQVTSAAAEQIRNAAEAQDDEPSLRVAAKIDDDGELVYGMGFDEERENDIVIDCEGVTLLDLAAQPRTCSTDDAGFRRTESRRIPVRFHQLQAKARLRNTDGPSGCGSCGGGNTANDMTQVPPNPARSISSAPVPAIPSY